MSHYRSRRRKVARRGPEAQSDQVDRTDRPHVPYMNMRQNTGGYVSGFLTKLLFFTLCLFAAFGIGAYGTVQGWFNPAFEHLNISTYSEDDSLNTQKDLLISKLEAEMAEISAQIDSIEAIAAGKPKVERIPPFPKPALLYKIEAHTGEPRSISSQARSSEQTWVKRLWGKHIQIGEQTGAPVKDIKSLKTEMRAKVLEAETLIEAGEGEQAIKSIESLPLAVRAVASDWLDHMRKTR